MDPSTLADGIFPALIEVGSRVQHSALLITIKVLLGIYTFVLFADFVLLLMFRGLRGNIRMVMMGADVPKIKKGKMMAQWESIEQRLLSDVESQYKVAIIEADKLVEGILGNMGYDGKNMKEKMEKIQPGQVDNFDELKRVHEIRNHIVYDAEFQVDRDMAKDALVVYKQFLKELEFFS